MIPMIALSVLGGILYRAGGIGKPYNTKWRDIGVPCVMLIAMSALGLWHWSLIPCFLLLVASLTTYNKWLGVLLGLGKDDVHWPSWVITGGFYGLSMLPYAYFTEHWGTMGIRVIALAILICLWSEWIKIDWLEEGGRGFLIVATLALFLL